jgi:hypothetical protein
MGRGGKCLILVQWVKAALEEGLSQLKGVPVLTVSGKTGKGIDQILKVALELRELGRGGNDRRAQPLVRGGDRDEPPPAPRAKDQAPLHHPGESRPPSFVVFEAGSMNCLKAIAAICSMRSAATSNLVRFAQNDAARLQNPFDQRSR